MNLRDKIAMDDGLRWSDPPGCAFWVVLVLAILTCAIGVPHWLVYG